MTQTSMPCAIWSRGFLQDEGHAQADHAIRKAEAELHGNGSIVRNQMLAELSPDPNNIQLGSVQLGFSPSRAARYLEVMVKTKTDLTRAATLAG